MLKKENYIHENCPKCNNRGYLVRSITVKNIVKDSFKDLVGDINYYLCMNEECNISYFNRENYIEFDVGQLKVPLWFKKAANPRYACYCSKVTDEEVVNAILNDGAKCVRDIIKITGAMKNAQCIKNNPLGKCCHGIIQSIIDRELL